MALFLASLVLLTVKSWGQTPDFRWAKRAGGSGGDGGRGIAVDRAGNSYFTGWFAGTAQFGSITMASAANFDIYVAKFDGSGNAQWARHAGGGEYNEGSKLALDSAGNCYVTGYFSGTANFGGVVLTSSGSGDMFVAKYDGAGNVLWAKRWGGLTDDRGMGIAVDSAGNSYVTGFSIDNTTFHIQVFKYDTAGNLLWSTSPGTGEGNSIAADGAGNCYVIGDDAGMLGGKIHVLKYNTAGAMVWSKNFSASGYGFGIALDGIGNVYLTGNFYGTGSFGSTVLNSAPGGADVFIAKLNSQGSVVWAQQAQGYDPQNSVGIAVDGAGDCYVTGYFSGTATFGFVQLTTGLESLFLAKYDKDGNVVWARQTTGTGWAFGHGLGLDGMGHCYLIAEFGGATTFGTITLRSSNVQDGDICLAMMPVETGDLVVPVEAPPTSGTSFTNVNQVIVTLRSAIPNALIFYSLDGSAPAPASIPYTVPFALTNSVSLRVVAYNPVDFSSQNCGPIPITILRGHYLARQPSNGAGAIVVRPPGDFFTNGMKVQLTATPDPGWTFVSWRGDLQGSTNPVALVMDRDWQVGAAFDPPQTFKLTVQANGGGSVFGGPSGSYPPGAVVNLTAQPNVGWLFLGWSGDTNATTTNLSLSMNRDWTVAANFQAIALLTATAGGGSIQGNAQPVYPLGTVVNLTAVPDPGWEFLSWLSGSQETNATLAVAMTGPREFQAVFGTQLYFTNVGSGTILSDWGAALVPWGATLRLQAVPHPGNYFGLWGYAARGTANPMDFVVTNDNLTVGALFLPLGNNEVTLAILAEGFGTAQRTPQANVYTNGQTVTLIATPDVGQQFIEWTGAVAGSQNPVDILLIDSQTVTARFTRNLVLCHQVITLDDGSLGLRVNFGAPLDGTYEVRSSTDCVNWSTFQVFKLSAGQAQFIDSAIDKTARQYFRVVLLP
jgi:hypothetical protein